MDTQYVLKIIRDGLAHPDPNYKQLCLEILEHYILNEVPDSKTKSTILNRNSRF